MPERIFSRQETYQTLDAPDESGAHIPASQDYKATSCAHKISLPPAGKGNLRPESGMVYGHHLCPHAQGISVFRGHHGLVQP